ncbi:hypothetical protein [Streptomyces sp. GS7]|nr:hypothetical protein [Streptomyces sp. GS7]
MIAPAVGDVGADFGDSAMWGTPARERVGEWARAPRHRTGTA